MERPVNWSFIVLTQLLVKLTHYIECRKKATAKLFSSKTKANNCYSKPILDILFRKRFPLFHMLSPRTTTLEELASLASQE
jgi:hypothetical protein